MIEEYEKEINHQLEKEQEDLEIEYLKPELKTKMNEEFKKHKKDQLILLKDNKQNIIDFLLDNKESIRIKNLKIYEPVYKCYKEKGNCIICNRLSNISCKNCNSHNNNRDLVMYKSLATT